MRFSRNWLARYVELPEVGELSRGLTAIGLTEEGLAERGDDVLLEIDVTTNRPDCMCYLGLAREIAVRFGKPLTPPAVALAEDAEETAGAIAVELEDGAGCPLYVARIVRGVRVGPSPDWLRARLESVGSRSINNVVDVTNFVLWESGQPVHAFDLDAIGGGRIVVRRARAGERLVTLDEEERELGPEVLVIADAERAVALAGVMGGLASEVTAETTDVLIECAHFDPRVVRRGARSLGIHTDASHRFERGADPEGPFQAAERVAALIAEVGGGRVLAGPVVAASDHRPGALAGRLDHGRLEAFGGVEVAPAEVVRILRGLGFGLEADGAGAWRVTVPSWRHHEMKLVDAAGAVYEADLFEEVLRHVGFDNVPSALPPVEAPDPGSSAAYELRRRVRGYLAACGLSEAIDYAFHAAADDGRFGIWNDGEPARVANPLSELYDVMRRSLVPGLVTSAGFNQRRGAEAVQLFECGALFTGAAGGEEREAVACVVGGSRGTPWERRVELDLFDLKGCVEGLAAHCGAAVEARAAELPGVVAGTGATLHAAGPPGAETGAAVGWIGRLDLEDTPYPLYAAELEVAVLAAGERFSPVVTPSRHPGIALDWTLTHPASLAWSELASAIEEAGVADLVAFGLKDRYAGERVARGAVNTTVYFVYNADDRSLTQDEVNARQQALTASLEARFGTSRA